MGKKGWRYQPVYHEDECGKAFTLCECHFGEDGKLESWTDPEMPPMGEALEALTKDLCRMLADTYKWEPVAFNSLYVGMTFNKTDAHVENMLAALEAAKWQQ